MGNTGLDVTFSKDTSTLLDQPGSKFLLLADSVDGQIGNLTTEVAFGINVYKSGIGNEDLGDNELALEVSKTWFDAKVAAGKQIFISKFNDAGDPVPPPQDVTNSCTSTTDPVVCKLTLTGTQGGLSVFALVAIDLGNNLPLATAAFIPVKVKSNSGTFTIVGAGTDPDGDSPTVIAVLNTPSTQGLKLKLKEDKRLTVEFDLKSGKLQIKSANPQATLESIVDLGGLQVLDGQEIKVKINNKQKYKFSVKRNGILEIEAPQVTLRVIATDALGASDTATANPTFAIETEEIGGADDDDDGVALDVAGTKDDDDQTPSPGADQDDRDDDDDENSSSRIRPTSRVVFSQAKASIIADVETRIQTPDGQVELIVPADFLTDAAVDQSTEFELKNLDPTTVQVPQAGGEFIRAIEVNGLVEGEDGALKSAASVVLAIPLSEHDIELAGESPSTLIAHWLNPETGTWEPLPTTFSHSSPQPRLLATLDEFDHATIAVFQTISPQRNPGASSALPVPNSSPTEQVLTADLEAGWSAWKITGASAAGAAIFFALIAGSVLIRRRN